MCRLQYKQDGGAVEEGAGANTHQRRDRREEPQAQGRRQKYASFPTVFMLFIGASFLQS